MLKFRSIEIENFVLFDRIVIEPSTDPNRPLTVVRAENGSGKTTLLRAIRWGMYGEDGLPGQRQRFPIQPPRWRPRDGDVRTEVALEFETDGSTRHNRQGRPTVTAYRLTRSVTTIPKKDADARGPDFHRIGEQSQLMVQGVDGHWEPHTAGVKAVVEQLLPFGLQDFFVMDADEAADFVGGSENKIMTHDEVVQKTTTAVHSLLGIDVFRSAARRTKGIARDFGALATKAVGDANLDALQQEYETLVKQHDDLQSKTDDYRSHKAELGDRLAGVNDDLLAEAKNAGAAQQLVERRTENRARHKLVARQHRDTSVALAGLLESSELLASLSARSIRRVESILAPLHEEGNIPLAHLHFVRGLVRAGTCVCGADLSNDKEATENVEERIRESEAKQGRANYLAQLYEVCQDLHGLAERGAWDDDRDELVRRLDGFERDLSNLDNVKRDIDRDLDQIDHAKIRVLRDEAAAIAKQMENTDRDLTAGERELPSLAAQIDSIKKKLDQRRRSVTAARDHQVAQFLADTVTDVLTRAYETIQVAQVRELSRRMNQLFHQMAANASDEDLGQVQHDKATLRMIAEVGLRPAEGKPGDYEIYALNSRGRSMPPIEINGASRRVLALSFVLALCRESRTDAPLVADSMLNFMSGAVRRNTLRITAQNARQPILLLTNSDMEAASEVEAVDQYGGATYTLTPQWEAGVGAKDGDVMRETEPGLVSLLCVCGPRQYCDVCERVGQSDRPDWTYRADGEVP